MDILIQHVDADTGMKQDPVSHAFLKSLFLGRGGVSEFDNTIVFHLPFSKLYMSVL